MKRPIRILIVLVVLDLFGLGALWFGYSTIMAKKEDELKLRQDITDETQKAMQFATLRKTLKQAAGEGDVLDKYFYDQGEESQIRFLAEIQALGASRTGLLVETSSFDFIPGAEPSFRGQFTLKGTWKEIYHFLRLLEEFPARIVIRNFNVSVPSGRNATSEWNGAIGIDLTSIKS